ncbi:MAG: NAD-dependent protein deacetylase, partial [Pseudomonadota bacterium]
MHDLRRTEAPRQLLTDIDAATDWLRRFLLHCKPLVLTGAGISIASGLPAYRDDAGRWQHAQPMQHRDFVTDDAARRRYWSRAMLGWQAFSSASPSAVHTVLAAWQAAAKVGLIATQNVDTLHQRAGSTKVVDLHGRLDQVVCLDCGDTSTRADMQARLRKANPDIQVDSNTLVKPDGDVGFELDDAHFDVPVCSQCSGRLKPDVVFYGDTVPAERVASVRRALDDSGALLVIGSSLSVYSGYRIARWAAEAQYPIT